MFSKNSYGSFDERPKYKAEQFFFRLPFLVTKVIERLLYRLCKLLPEGSWVEGQESPVELADGALFIHHKRRFSGKVSALAPV